MSASKYREILGTKASTIENIFIDILERLELQNNYLTQGVDTVRSEEYGDIVAFINSFNVDNENQKQMISSQIVPCLITKDGEQTNDFIGVVYYRLLI